MSAAGQAKQQKNLADLGKQDGQSTYVATEWLRTFGRQQFYRPPQRSMACGSGPGVRRLCPTPPLLPRPLGAMGPLFFTTSADGT